MEEKKGKKKDRYFAIGARGVLYNYEMVDDVVFWAILSAAILLIVGIVICLTAPEDYIIFLCSLLFVAEFAIVVSLSIHHIVWSKSLKKADRFTVLFDVGRKEYVLLLPDKKEKRIAADKMVSARANHNVLFNPLLEIFKLNEKHIGNLVFTYVNEEGDEEEIIVNDIDKPEIALLRIEMVKDKYLKGEEIEESETLSVAIEVEGEHNEENVEVEEEDEGKE